METVVDFNYQNDFGGVDSEKPSFIVKWFKLLGINLLAFGLELCASAGFCYIAPIMLKKGFSEGILTIILGIGPLISLFLVPTLGYWSDRCTCRFGRRRPFLFVLGILILLSLLLIPYSYEIALFSGLISDSYILTIGVILLDFSTQAMMNPCKALIPDIYGNVEERDSGFTTYSFMLSLGGGIGYLISSINLGNTALGIYIGGQEKAVFFVLTVCFLLLLVMNLIIANESPLQKLDHSFSSSSKTNVSDNIVEEDNIYNNHTNGSVNLKRISYEINSNNPGFYVIFQNFNLKGLRNFIHSFSNNVCFIVSIPLKLVLIFKLNLSYLFHMAPVLLNLFLSCLFGWMGLMCHDSYYTDFVGQVIYQGKPKAKNESVSLNLYNQGVRMGSWGLLLHCLSAAVYSAVQHRLISRFGQRKVFLSGIVIFFLSMIGTVQTNSLVLANIFCALSGAGYIAFTTVPYSLVTFFHSTNQIHGNGKRGIGEDMAIIDSACYLSQIIPCFFLGYVVDFYGSPSIYMALAALCGAAACCFSFFIEFPPKTICS